MIVQPDEHILCSHWMSVPIAGLRQVHELGKWFYLLARSRGRTLNLLLTHSTTGQQFLSLSKAEQHIGKSRHTLHRFVEGITKPKSHSDRQIIKPTPDEVAELHKNNYPFSWKIAVKGESSDVDLDGPVDPLANGGPPPQVSTMVESTEKFRESGTYRQTEPVLHQLT